MATILEVVRALGRGTPLRNDLIVLLTDAEELGLLGARTFVAEHPWMADVTVVLSLEMRGGGGASIMFETGGQNGWIIEALQASGARPYANSLSFEVYRRLPQDTDFTPFKQAGKQGLNYAGIGRAHVYHQAWTHQRTSTRPRSSITARTSSRASRSWATASSPHHGAPTSSSSASQSWGSSLIPLRWSIAIAAGLVLSFLLALRLVRRQGPPLRGVLAGVLIGAVATSSAAGAGWGLFRQLAPRHPEHGLLAGSAFHSEGWYVLALASLALFLVSGLLALARRNFQLAPLALGSLVLPLAGAVALAFLLPMAAMNLQWPVLAAVLSALVVLRLGPKRRPGRLALVLLLLLAVPVLALLVPLTELLWMALSFSRAPLLGALAALILLLLLPLLDALRDPNGSWAPLTALLAAIGFLGLGLLASRPSAEHPTPTTLMYLLDRETERALWATRQHSGLDWATERFGSFSLERPLGDFQLGALPNLVRAAPLFDVAPLEIAVRRRLDGTAASTQGGAADTVTSRAMRLPRSRVRLRLSVRSVVSAEALAVRLTESGRARVTAVNGREIAEGVETGFAQGVRSLVHWGEPESGFLVLDLEMDPSSPPIALEVVEHLLRPNEIVGSEPFRRPPHLAPAASIPSDRALFRSVLRISPDIATPAPPGGDGQPMGTPVG